MNILAFDTCFNACSVAVGIDVGSANSRLVHRFEPMETGQAERLIPLIGEVLAQAALTIEDIDQIGVTTGPGTFTGTRIGISAAKALALACSVPVVGLSSLALMARQAAIEVPQNLDICVVIDVRREEVYTQLFDPDGLVAKSEPALMTIQDAQQVLRSPNIVAVGNGASLVVSPPTAQSYGCAMLPNLLPDAKYAVDLLSQSHGTPDVIPRLTPLYLRAPDAKPSAPNILQRH